MKLDSRYLILIYALLRVPIIREYKVSIIENT
jgi:hypothetical protein